MTDIRIHRTQPNGNFTVVRNEVFDAGLRPEALGLLVYLISRPANWVVSQAQLQKLFAVGRDKLKGILRELEDAGYVVRQQARDPETQAFARLDFLVYDKPIGGGADGEPSGEGAGGAEPLTEKPLTGEPSTGEPLTANPHPTKNNNNNIYNTKSPLPPSAGVASAEPERRKRKRKRQRETPVLTDRQQVFIEQFSPEWEAWRKHRGRPFPTVDRRDDETGRFVSGWWVDSRWPPGCAEGSMGGQERKRG